MAGLVYILNERSRSGKKVNLKLVLAEAGFPMIDLSVTVLPRNGEWIVVDGVSFKIDEIIHKDGITYAEVVKKVPPDSSFPRFAPPPA